MNELRQEQPVYGPLHDMTMSEWQRRQEIAEIGRDAEALVRVAKMFDPLRDERRERAILEELSGMVTPPLEIEDTRIEPITAGLPQSSEEGGQEMIRDREGKRRNRKTEKKLSEGVEGLRERHLMVGDHQYPDTDMKAVRAVNAFNQDFKATHLHIMGDLLNASAVSVFDKPKGTPSLSQELEGARDLLKDIVGSARDANPDVVVNFYFGNHEQRVEKFIEKFAPQLSSLKEVSGEETLNLGRLLGFKELGINAVPYWTDGKIKDTAILHGNRVRSRSGYTAHAYVDAYGESAVAGHTHRLALVFRTQSGNVKFGMETGSMCKRKMGVPYVRANQADWQQGIGILGIDQQGDAHPGVIPIIKGKLAFGGRVYRG